MGFFDYAAPSAQLPAPAFLESATLTDWSRLMDYGSRQMLDVGEQAITIGDRSRSLLIVLSGSLEVTEPTRWRGRERLIGAIESGSVVGELSFFDGSPRSTNVTALEPCELFVLEWEAFERLAAVRPAFAITLLEELVRIVAGRFRAIARTHV